MTPFEYVIVLISVIIGLGITTILAGVAEHIKSNRINKHYAPYYIWIILVFVLHIHEWWISYELKAIETWRLPMFLFIISYPINLYILAHLLFPSFTDEPFDAESFYLNRYPKLFVSAIVLDVLSIFHNLTITDLSSEPWFIRFQILQILVLVLLTFTLITRNKNVVAHLMISLFLLILMLISLFIIQDTLLISQ